MTTIETQARSKIAAALRNFESWAQKRAGAKRYNPLEVWCREYEHWDKLASAFVYFLTTRPANEWNKRDISLAHRAVVIDWAHYRLLRSVPQDQLMELLIQPYPDETVRMHMLTRAKHIEDINLRRRILLHFFDKEPSDTIRDGAFTGLAITRWDKTEHYAIQWWQSNDSVKQMVALTALEAAKSELLAHYLQMAIESEDPSLHRVARALSTLDNIDSKT